MRLGRLLEVSYEFRVGTSSNFTEAVRELCEHQRERPNTRRPTLGVSLEEALEHRQLLTQLYYRQWAKEANSREPAGYLVHFSPPNGQTRGHLLEFGFSGDQTLVAWAQLEFGYRKNVPLYRDRGRKVLDFFVQHCQLDMFAMRSLLKAYETLGQPQWLRAAEKAAKILCSWVYLWDVPMPSDTFLSNVGFKSTGWAGCDVIASGSYLDDEFLEFTGDLIKVAQHCGNESLFDYAELVEFGMQHALSTPRNDHGYVAPRNPMRRNPDLVLAQLTGHNRILGRGEQGQGRRQRHLHALILRTSCR